MNDTVESTVIIMKKIEMFFMVSCGIFAIVLTITTLVKIHYGFANMAELKAANNLIYEVIEDWESFYDSTGSGDTYQEWVKYQK